MASAGNKEPEAALSPPHGRGKNWKKKAKPAKRQRWNSTGSRQTPPVTPREECTNAIPAPAAASRPLPAAPGHGLGTAAWDGIPVSLAEPGDN